tara:strand:- start:237 stop:782 length:546 start_codon:yes stop_codon:yes gene_type:complete
LEIIFEFKKLNPNLFWWLENPRGMMRYQPELSAISRVTVTHGSYHDPAASHFGLPGDAHVGMPEGHLPPCKPTDLWGDFPGTWTPRPYLQKKFGGILYMKAPRGSRTGIQGMDGSAKSPSGEKIGAYWVRSLIPFYLGWDTITAVERELGVEAPIDYIFHTDATRTKSEIGFEKWFGDDDE